MNKEKLTLQYNHLVSKYDHLNIHWEEVYHNHRCNDTTLVLCDRKYTNGSSAYVYQCEVCGYQKGGAIKKEKAIQLLNGEVIPFQNTLVDTYQNKRRKLIKVLNRIKNRLSNIQNQLDGKKLVETKPLPDFSERIIKEENFMKDLYLQLKETYKSDEGIHSFLGRFRSFINNEYILQKYLENSEVNRFTKEDEIKEWFVKYFIEDFYIEEEVSGYHIVQKQNVKIDFIIYPRKHLENKGFINECIGIEVKYIDPMSEDLAKKANKSIWQTISYNDCLFGLKSGKQIQPKFCMVFSNLSFDYEENLYKEFPHAHNKRIWFYYLLLANHANVGELRIKGTREEPTGWSFRFGNSGVYFRKKTDDNSIYEIGNPNLAIKKRIGNFQ